MVDFRKLLSPASRAQIARRNAIVMEFQDLAPKEMADALLTNARTLQDSGCFSPDQRYSYDEWALYRVVPEVALALDPDVVLRDVEQPDPKEAEDQVTWLRGAAREKLEHCIKSILANGSFQRALLPEVDPGVRLVADVTFRESASLFSVAADQIFPGSFPRRAQPDSRPPLPGRYLVEIGETGFERARHYSDEPDIVDRYFDVAVKMREGIFDEEDLDIRNNLARNRFHMNVVALQVQGFDGEVVREKSFVNDLSCEDDPTP